VSFFEAVTEFLSNLLLNPSSSVLQSLRSMMRYETFTALWVSISSLCSLKPYGILGS
jgi:hypothetical protein